MASPLKSKASTLSVPRRVYRRSSDAADTEGTLYSIDPFSTRSIYDDQMASLLEKQTELLRQLLDWQTKQDEHTREQIRLLSEINARQEVQDASRSSTPSVPVRSASAWNPLLKSTLKKMSPTIDRWRGGLDTLLIFVGLFSAIVTSFLVQALQNIKPEPGDRTNDLLANLTEIIIVLSGANTSSFSWSEPDTFEPDPEDVRLNIYCFAALIFALCTAVLAVIGRSFLSKLMRPDGDAISRLTDIHLRWTGAQTSLGPFLESLPLTLSIPVFIFALGLLDYITSISLSSETQVQYLDSASAIGATAVSLTALVALFTIYHGIRHPATSPFQSGIGALFRWRHRGDDPQTSPPSLSKDNLNAFHELIQDTHDDETLTHAVGPLNSLLKSHWSWDEREVNTMLHLLSFEASLQCQLNVMLVLAKRDLSGLINVPISVRVQLLSAVLAIEKYHTGNNIPPGQLVRFPYIITVVKLSKSIILGDFADWDHMKNPLLALLSTTAYKHHVHPDHQWIIEVVSFRAIRILTDVFGTEFFTVNSQDAINDHLDTVFGVHALDFSECQILAIGLALSQDIHPHIFEGMMGWILSKVSGSLQMQLFSSHVLKEALKLVSGDEHKQMYRALFRLCWLVNKIGGSLDFPANMDAYASFTSQMTATVQRKWSDIQALQPTLWSDTVFTFVIKFLELSKANLLELSVSVDSHDIIIEISTALGSLCALLSSANPVTLSHVGTAHRRLELTHQLVDCCVLYITTLEDRDTKELIRSEQALDALVNCFMRLVDITQTEKLEIGLKEKVDKFMARMVAVR